MMTGSLQLGSHEFHLWEVASLFIDWTNLFLGVKQTQLVWEHGMGALSTAAGTVRAALVRSDGGEAVTRGTIVSMDLTRSASGTVSKEATDVTVMIVFRPDGPR